MVKAKKSYKKKSSYISKKNFLRIASNYSRVKFDLSRRFLLSSQNFQFENASETLSIADILTACPDFQWYRQLYQSMKVTGVAATIVPMLSSSDFATDGSYTFALLTDTDGLGFGNVVEADKSIILDFDTTHRRYWSFGTGSTGWIGIEDSNLLPGKFGLAKTNLPSAGTMYWTVKFTVYVLLKVKN